MYVRTYRKWCNYCTYILYTWEVMYLCCTIFSLICALWAAYTYVHAMVGTDYTTYSEFREVMRNVILLSFVFNNQEAPLMGPPPHKHMQSGCQDGISRVALYTKQSNNTNISQRDLLTLNNSLVNHMINTWKVSDESYDMHMTDH